MGVCGCVFMCMCVRVYVYMDLCACVGAMGNQLP